MKPAGLAAVASGEDRPDVPVDVSWADLALGSAGAIDRLIARTQGQVALGVAVGRLVGHKVGLPVPAPAFSALDEPRVHPVRAMASAPNVSPLRPSDRLSATAVADEQPGADSARGPDLEGPAESKPSAEALAIPGYDELAASQVVRRLDGLDAAELAAIGEYERVNRGRRTILGRVTQLQSET